MLPNNTDVSVAVFIYKRPDLVVKTLAGVRKGKPTRVYLIADGPKTTEDANLCEETRQVSEQAIDWDCLRTQPLDTAYEDMLSQLDLNDTIIAVATNEEKS